MREPDHINVHGTKFWFNNNRLHRLDGPAMLSSDNDQYWFIDDNRHREDGPAILLSSNSEAFYLESVRFFETEFNIVISI